MDLSGEWRVHADIVVDGRVIGSSQGVAKETITWRDSSLPPPQSFFKQPWDALMVVGAGGISGTAVSAAESGWSASCPMLLGEQLLVETESSPLHPINSARVEFNLAEVGGLDRVPIGVLSLDDVNQDSSPSGLHETSMVGLEQALARTPVPAVVVDFITVSSPSLYGTSLPVSDIARIKQKQAMHAAFELATLVDLRFSRHSPIYDGLAPANPLDVVTDFPATMANVDETGQPIPLEFDSSGTVYDALVSLVGPLGLIPMFDRWGDFVVLGFPDTPAVFSFTDNDMFNVQRNMTSLAATGVAASVQPVNRADAGALADYPQYAESWLDSDNSVSPMYTSWFDPAGSRLSSGSVVTQSISNGDYRAAVAAAEMSRNSLLGPERISFTTQAPKLLELGDIGWIRSERMKVDGRYRIVSTTWAWDDGGHAPMSSFVAQKVPQ